MSGGYEGGFQFQGYPSQSPQVDSGYPSQNQQNQMFLAGPFLTSAQGPFSESQYRPAGYGNMDTAMGNMDTAMGNMFTTMAAPTGYGNMSTTMGQSMGQSMAFPSGGTSVQQGFANIQPTMNVRPGGNPMQFQQPENPNSSNVVFDNISNIWNQHSGIQNNSFGMNQQFASPQQREPQQQVPQQPQQQQQRQPPDFNASLSAAALAAAPPDMQKQMIGSKLYPTIAKYQPQNAAKITGMMLEMDNSDLLILLESETQMRNKIDEAMRVLEAVQQQQQLNQQHHQYQQQNQTDQRQQQQQQRQPLMHQTQPDTQSQQNQSQLLEQQRQHLQQQRQQGPWRDVFERSPGVSQSRPADQLGGRGDERGLSTRDNFAPRDISCLTSGRSGFGDSGGRGMGGGSNGSSSLRDGDMGKGPTSNSLGGGGSASRFGTLASNRPAGGKDMPNRSKDRNLFDRIQSLVDDRQECRRSRAFDKADRIRDDLLDMGVTVDDTSLKWTGPDGLSGHVMSGLQQGKGDPRPGDWQCNQCGANVFASKSSCFRCGADKPAGEDLGGALSSARGRQKGNFDGNGKDGGGKGRLGKGGNPHEFGKGGKDDSRPADWTCGNCGAKVFGSRRGCFRCGASKDATNNASSQPPPPIVKDDPNAEPIYDNEGKCIGRIINVTPPALQRPSDKAAPAAVTTKSGPSDKAAAAAVTTKSGPAVPPKAGDAETAKNVVPPKAGYKAVPPHMDAKPPEPEAPPARRVGKPAPKRVIGIPAPKVDSMIEPKGIVKGMPAPKAKG